MDKLEPLLRELAAKLGTTVEQLWPSLVLHKRIESIGDIIGLGLLAIVMFALFWFSLGSFGKATTKDDKDTMGVITCFTGVLCLIVGVVVASSAPDKFADAISPEAAVIYDLISKAK